HVHTGLYLTGAYLQQDNDAPGVKDTTLAYVNGGIAKNWTGLGNTVLYGEAAPVRDAAIICPPDTLLKGVQFFTNADTDGGGLGVVQNFDAAAMELFLSYRNYSADTPQVVERQKAIKDFDVIMGGARIRF